VSAWIKYHHPDAFLAALLNSQPMGFYAPAQLVRDARERGVCVRPVDVARSAWDSTLEVLTPDNADEVHRAAERALHPAPPGLRAVRLGLNRLNGLAEAAAQRIVAARAEQPFDSVEDLARRASLDQKALNVLADGNALHTLAGHRREAAWAVAGIDTRAAPLLKTTRTHETEVPQLQAPQAGESLIADYRSTGLSLDAHPLALLRPQLARFKVETAAVLRHYRNGQLARASGIVTHRQRPETARGVIFVTLEDETGHVNVIVWPQVAEQQRKPLLASRLLTVYGIWQTEGEVRHLVARKLVDHTPLMAGLAARSRDFH